ncbi:MAG: nucleoside deaminase [Clostridia bacterium]|nr:nucleoside deaminase [Clostridia bacterium]
MKSVYFMKEALKLAEAAAANGEVPVGAVIVKNGEIIARGKNECEKGKSAVFHAEIQAIKEAGEALGGWRLSDCEMYVTLEPCAMCAGAIINSRLSTVVFGAYDERAGACISRLSLFEEGLGQKVQLIGGFMEEECSSVLKRFFEEKRR